MFERRAEGTNAILPVWAYGACGWLAASASNVDTARERIIRDVEHHSLRVIELTDEQEVFADLEIAQRDERLAENVRTIEPGKQSAWGTLHCYKGDAEA